MANKYWVGGTASWDSVAGTKWSLTSGGAGGATIPTSADDVFFDSLSTGTCSIGSGNTGAKSINCTGFAGTLTGSFDITVSGSVTLNASMTYTHNGRMTINANGVLTTAGKTFGELRIDGAGITVTLADNLITGGLTNSVSLVAGTLNLAGFTLTTGTFDSSNTNTRAINFGSGGSIVLVSTLTSHLTMSVANNFTWSGNGDFRRNLSLGDTSINFGSTSGGTVANAPNLTITVGGFYSLFVTSGSYLKNLTFIAGASTGSVSATYNACGNLTLPSTGMSAFNIFATFLESATITSNGRAINGNQNINGAGITVALADNFNINGRTLTLTQGTFNAANFNVALRSFSSSNTNTRTLNMGSGTWTIENGNWNTTTSTGLTLNPGTSTISMFSGPPVTTQTFNGGGLIYYNLNNGGYAPLTITGNNTFNSITNSVSPTTITFTAGTTQVVSNFGLSGSSGNYITTINSSIPGSQFTLSKSSGTVNAQYLSIQDSNAIGGATWNAVASLNLGNNSGWFFSGGNMLLMFM